MKKILLLLFLFIVSCGPSEEEIQAQIDEAVEEALQKVSTTNTSTTSTSTNTTSTSTTSTSTSTTSTSTTTTSTSTSTTTIYVDNEPPTWPDKTVTIANMNPTYFEVIWKPASDNTNVAGYRFYLDNIFKGEYIRNNDNNSIFLDGLTGGATYTLEIIAYDDESNQSIDNPTLTITTSTPTTTTTTLPIYGKTEKLPAGLFIDCVGNGCIYVLTCNSGDHTAYSSGAQSLPGQGGPEGDWEVISETLFQKGEYSGAPLESGALFEFNSITQENYNLYSDDEWGFWQLYLDCKP